jgi:hypothetical protein
MVVYTWPRGECGKGEKPRVGRGMAGFFVHLLPCQFDLPARIALNLTTYLGRRSAREGGGGSGGLRGNGRRPVRNYKNY